MAQLDAQAGIEWVGEPSPEPTLLDQLHFSAYRLLGNGMGGVDWAGLPYVVEHLGVRDVGALIQAIDIINTYKPDTGENIYGDRKIYH